MVLRVTDSMDYSMKYYNMTVTQFSNKEYHLYIASRQWDYVLLDFVENTPAYIISQVRDYLTIVPYVYNDLLYNVNVMKCIAALYPDVSAKLRAAFTKDKDKYTEIVNQLKENYKWVCV